MKKQKEKDPLRLMRWADDGYPPIKLENELDAIMELILAYRTLRIERDRYKNKCQEFIQWSLLYGSKLVSEKISTSAEKDMVYAESLIEFVYRRYTFRIWVKGLSQAFGELDFDESSFEQTVEGIINNIIGIDPLHNAYKVGRAILLGIKEVNAIQVNFEKQKKGIVLYKNWP